MSVISEEFDSPTARFVNYDTNDILLYDSLKDRKHIDVRSFSSDLVTVPRIMLFFNENMGELDTMTMEEISSLESVLEAEEWNEDDWETVGAPYWELRFTNRRNSLYIDMAAGDFIQLSSLSDHFISLTDFAPTDHFCLALPGFPNSAISKPNSEVIIEDHTGIGRSLGFDDGIISNVGANYEIRWPLSALGTTTIKNIFLRLEATGAGIVKINSMRILPANFSPLATDIDTKLNRLAPSVDRYGVIPSTKLPHMWRSAPTPGPDDPRPFNADLAINFDAGTTTFPYDNESKIKIFGRGRREDFLTQLDLDGLDDGTITSPPSIGSNQWSLEQSGRQPDYGQAVYNPRPQADLNNLTQEQLSDAGGGDAAFLTQAQLERLPDTISESWLEVTLTWGYTGAKIVIGTTETMNDDDRYEFVLPGLSPQRYGLLVGFRDSQVAVSIYPITSAGEFDLNNILFETRISDEFIFPRRKGRIGWEVDLQNEGAWVDSIRSRGLMYGEFVTNAFESITPVVGAQVFSGGSSQVISNTGLTPVNEPILEPDSHNSRSADGSLKVIAEAGDGVQTTPFLVEDFAHTEIQFDLYFPKTTLNQGITLDAGLISQYGAVQLILPELVGDQWQRCRVPLTKASLQQTGNYRFFLLNQDQTTWWIDNVQIVQYTISWSGRAVADDAWNSFQDDWTDFKHMTDNTATGALFSERGKYLQIRGQTLTDTAGFDKVYIKPRYAELGRFAWDIGRQYR